MTRKILFVAACLLAYQVVAIVFLYNSAYLNVVSYYTHPPTKGNIEIGRLPVFFGDSIARYFLERKQLEARKLVQSGGLGLAAVLASYEHNQFLSEKEAKRRAIEVANLFIVAGYDPLRCEDSGKSTAKTLADWRVFDADMREFLVQFMSSEEFFVCY